MMTPTGIVNDGAHTEFLIRRLVFNDPSRMRRKIRRRSLCEPATEFAEIVDSSPCRTICWRREVIQDMRLDCRRHIFLENHFGVIGYRAGIGDSPRSLDDRNSSIKTEHCFTLRMVQNCNHEGFFALVLEPIR